MKLKSTEMLFFGGVLVALFANRFVSDMAALQMTVAVGILLGVVNVTKVERSRFLLAMVALSIMGIAAFQTMPIVGTFVGNAIKSLVALTAPAAAVVAIYEIVPIVRNK